MRLLLAIAPLAALMLAGSACAQQPAAERACVGRNGPPIEYLQKLARQYHSEALAPAAQHDSMVVAFVFDSTCQVVRHGVGRYWSDSSHTTDSVLARLFPELSATNFSSEGVVASEPLAPGHLIIVYGLLKRP
jgi:hypothetical protein